LPTRCGCANLEAYRRARHRKSYRVTLFFERFQPAISRILVE